MRHYFILAAIALLLSSPVLSRAQDGTRIVRGVVQSEDGTPLPDATITSELGDIFRPNSDGTFEIRVGFVCRNLSFAAPFYKTRSYEIDGSFLLVSLKRDKESQKKEQNQSQAEKKTIIKEKPSSREKEPRKKERQQSEYREKKVPLEHSFSLSYAYQINKCTIVYLYEGIQQYGSLHPMILDYTLSYKKTLNKTNITVGVGAGVLYDIKSIRILGDEIVYTNSKGDERVLENPERRLDIPVFATLKLRFGHGKVRPAISVSGGYYPLSMTGLLAGSVGVDCRLGKHSSFEAGMQVRTTPYPYFDLYPGTRYGYKMSLSPAVYVRFNL